MIVGMETQKDREIRALQNDVRTFSNLLITARREGTQEQITRLVEALADAEEALRNRELLP